MLSVTSATRVLVATTPVDLRGSFNRLYGLVVEQLKGDPLSGHLFVFTNTRRNRIKVLYWDGTGLCLFAKRLEKGRFAAPWERSREGALRWTMSELSLFLEGSDLVGRIRLSPEPWLPGAARAAA